MSVVLSIGLNGSRPPQTVAVGDNGRHVAADGPQLLGRVVLAFPARVLSLAFTANPPVAPASDTWGLLLQVQGPGVASVDLDTVPLDWKSLSAGVPVEAPGLPATVFPAGTVLAVGLVPNGGPVALDGPWATLTLAP